MPVEKECFYCHKEMLPVQVCIDCRTRLEIAHKEVVNHRKMADVYRSEYAKVIKENARLKAELSKVKE